MINIALATDDNYAKACAICAISILENNTNCRIYILTQGLCKNNRLLFERLNTYFPNSIKIVFVDITIIKSIKVDTRFPLANYFRLLLPEIVTCDKILYLDCDILVRKDILDFYETDLTEKACGVIPDQRCDDIIMKNRVGIDTPYFNAGVLLINLEYWRAHNIAQKVIDIIIENTGKSVYQDQDALNKLLWNDVVWCSFSFNFAENYYYSLDNMYIHRSRWTDIENSKLDPSIVHFVNPAKPWHRDCTNPNKKQFLDYGKKYGIHIDLKYSKSMSIRFFSFLMKCCGYMIHKIS